MPYKAEHVSCAGTQLSVLSPHSLHRLLGMFRNTLKKIQKKTKTRIQKKNHVDNFRTPPIFWIARAPRLVPWLVLRRADRQTFAASSQHQQGSARRRRVCRLCPHPRRAAGGELRRAESNHARRIGRRSARKTTSTSRTQVRSPKNYAPYRAHTFTPRVFAWQIMSLRARASTGAVLPGALLR